MTAPAVFATFDRLLRDATGQALEPKRFTRAEAALEPIVRSHGLSGVDALADLLRGGDGPAIAAQCVEALLNQETSFFRDHATFAMIGESILPWLAGQRAASRRLSLWSAGCSTGQEAYSLAMLVAAAPSRWAGWHVEILGTDVSDLAVRRARTGCYNQFEIQRGLPVREMVRHFEQVGDRWCARADLRRRVRFVRARLPDPRGARTRRDLILCRNLLLYREAGERTRLLESMADWLSPDGVLILGAAETIIGHTDRLVPSRHFRGCYRHAGAED